ncbi:hypothetical protein XarbCFBP7408_03060 [Xanthomonas arboricola pv. guizotiae]|uniref:Uncharacterized protein n=1 Tax=Xanthomonas arboricola pv. guizotiae TaxID=487867 RepID=A0A2S7A7I2_9XANT|nr:hypothetical protein XarbCFBP7409_01535 [Xanthomonas arboricola pv. guizotiae]PPU26630.1 hypothetical protein XarbCFBP7408_03060 [Xanthomonas arboricola pv. guizotiae]
MRHAGRPGAVVKPAYGGEAVYLGIQQRPGHENTWNLAQQRTFLYAQFSARRLRRSLALPSAPLTIAWSTRRDRVPAPSPIAPAAATRLRQLRPHPKLSVPFIIAQWPGNEQKKV